MLAIDNLWERVYADSMSDEQTAPGISAEDWAATPIAVRELVLSLLERLAALEEHVNQTSRNSSKPPSSDPPNAPPRPRPPASGRKAGGQPGHAGQGRPLKPTEQVNRLVVNKPISCAACGALLLGEDPRPLRHQVTELPRIEPEVTEYQRHALTCLACGARTQPDWPAEMPSGSFGPRVQATVGYLTGRIGASQREVKEVLEAVFHADLGLGSIPALAQAVSEALAQPVAEAQAYVQAQPVNNVDETSWRERTQRTWLWVSATPLVTVFLLVATRGGGGLKQLLGEVYTGIVGSDRWSAYNWLDPKRRQLCWAHLKRDFQAFVERGGEPARLGQDLLECVEQLFGLWHGVRDGPVSRADFQVAMQPIQTRVGELLRVGVQLAHDKTRRTCAKILALEVALWTFVRIAGVEPTNNGAERPLRRAVLWRRRSFGTHSGDGSRFVERILTTVTTLRQQKRDVLDYLTEACAAPMRGDAPLSLLPKASTSHSAT